MRQHLLRHKNGAIAVADEAWKQNPESIRQFQVDIPDIFKNYYRDAVVIPVHAATNLHDIIRRLTEINNLVTTAATMDETQRQTYRSNDLGDNLARLYDSVIAILADVGGELEEEDRRQV